MNNSDDACPASLIILSSTNRVPYPVLRVWGTWVMAHQRLLPFHCLHREGVGMGAGGQKINTNVINESTKWCASRWYALRKKKGQGKGKRIRRRCGWLGATQRRWSGSQWVCWTRCFLVTGCIRQQALPVQRPWGSRMLAAFCEPQASSLVWSSAGDRNLIRGEITEHPVGPWAGPVR